MHTTRDSLVLDDLEPGRWYEFITLKQKIYRGQWEGIDRRLGALRIPPSYLPLFPDGCVMVKSTRDWAQCIITAIPEPRDVRLTNIAEDRDHLDAADNQVLPCPHRDLRLLLGLLAASAVGRIALFLYAFPFWR